ncbi:30S ribosomal protein S9 [Patescibacteria group bacterium]
MKNFKPKKKAYIYNVGKRKTSVATVRLYKKGEGKISINSLDLADYFKEVYLQQVISSPLEIVTQRNNLNVSVRVLGGGKRGQAEGIRNGIAKALLELNPNFRKPLKKAGFLTRDSRKKERKKPGLKSARRAHQWRKR